MATKSWTAEQIALLRRLWADGQTAAAIAARLGGMSRSAVLGKVFRLRLDVDSPAKAARKQRGSVAPAPGAGAVQIARRRRSPKRSEQPQTSIKATRRHKTLLELTNTTCHLPLAARPAWHREVSLLRRAGGKSRTRHTVLRPPHATRVSDVRGRAHRSPPGAAAPPGSRAMSRPAAMEFRL